MVILQMQIMFAFMLLYRLPRRSLFISQLRQCNPIARLFKKASFSTMPKVSQRLRIKVIEILIILN
jgi:hypothetical protein